MTTLNKNCHEIVNDDPNYYESVASLNMNATEDNGFLYDDETEEMENVDFSTDPHQRLIV